jgi:hypothetical protein
MSLDELTRYDSKVLVQHRPPEWRRGKPIPTRCPVCGDPDANLYETRLVECRACGAIRVQMPPLRGQSR